VVKNRLKRTPGDVGPFMESISAQIFCRWNTRSVSIKDKIITLSKFVYDLKKDEEEPGDNQDIIDECKGVKRSKWGDDAIPARSMAPFMDA
jgi:hypothetical protein